MTMTRIRASRALAVIAALALALAACGGGDDDDSGSGDEGTPAAGGTLKLVGAGDVDHLDTAAGYYSPTYLLFRGITRQLVTYPNEEDFEVATTPVADLVEDVPEPTNDGVTYTFTIRDGTQWDAPDGPRQITAADAARGFKRLCNPVAPTGAPDYFQGVIAGMTEFCTGFSAVAPEVGPIRDYVEGNEISGITAVDDRTLEITLERPASDVLNILALPFSSPAPVEALDYLPDSPEFRANFVSSGPYKIENYTANQQITLIRNPAWNADSDDIREAYVDRIEIQLGSDAGPIQRQLEAGTADMTWDTQVPTADIPRLQDANDEKLSFNRDGSANPYLVMNLQSPNNDGALGTLEVRQAINYAVDKQAIVQTLGGPQVQEPIGQILTPTITGHVEFNPFETENAAGDPDRARELLAQAGYPDGLTLKMPYRNAGNAPALAQTVQQSLGEAGITLELIATTGPNFYTEFLQNPDAGARGDWDIALPGWGPDWQGNAARSFFVPLLDGRNCGPGSTNYGCYNNAEVNDLTDQALSAESPEQAGEIWHQADQLVMADAPWAPLVTGSTVNYRSERVRGWHYMPAFQNGDITNVWLAQ